MSILRQPNWRRPGKTGYMYFFRTVSIFAFGTAPTIWSTSFPCLTTSIVGIAIMPKRPDTAGFSSVFSFPNTTLPEYSFANASTIGPTIRQGPHHGAQQSMSVREYFWTNWSKVESSTLTGSAGKPAISVNYNPTGSSWIYSSH